jgi:hypothetical protein
MKKVLIYVKDDSKYSLFVNFLKEIRGIQIETEDHFSVPMKKMTSLPQSIFNPVKVKQFKMFNREELHVR